MLWGKFLFEFMKCSLKFWNLFKFYPCTHTHLTRQNQQICSYNKSYFWYNESQQKTIRQREAICFDFMAQGFNRKPTKVFHLVERVEINFHFLSQESKLSLISIIFSTIYKFNYWENQWLLWHGERHKIIN
jgi:hypothetical protein